MNIKKLITTILSLALVFCLCACGDNTAKDTESEIKEDKAKVPKFSVTVTDDEGKAVEGVILQLHKKSVMTARTNRNGVASFNVFITDGYRLSIFKCPDGYIYNSEDTINVAPGSLNLSIQITKK